MNEPETFGQHNGRMTPTIGELPRPVRAEGTWQPVASAGEITTRPRGLVVDGQPIVVVRLQPGGPAVAFVDRCPHRLVPLSGGTVVDGALRCGYHGWRFDGSGRCALVPSLGPDANIPPRAHLSALRVREEDGRVYVCVSDLPAPVPDDGLTNLDPALHFAWHPAALADEVGAAPVPVMLAGRLWTLRRVSGRVVADPVPYALTERWGLVWLAPDRPATDLFDEPDLDDVAYTGRWLAPARTPVPAGAVADNFLDVAHFPFVHAGTFGAAEEPVVPAYQVTDEPDGCRAVQEQWFDNPADPGVAAGIRPVRQRRRATYVYRAPFQLMLRLEELDTGAVKTILCFVAPEHLTSSRIYTKLLVYGIGGVPEPGPAVLAREVAFEEAVLAEDLALQRRMTRTALPLSARSELHVRADRLAVALRRELRAFADRVSGSVPPP
jgi:phenylpropionate dioxygenase-like ring-hydroxylating dioxygenase large terminal subunit